MTIRPQALNSTIFLLIAGLTLFIYFGLNPIVTWDLRQILALSAVLLAELAAWLMISRLIQGSRAGYQGSYMTYGMIAGLYFVAAVVAAFLAFLPLGVYITLHGVLLLVAVIASALVRVSYSHIQNVEQGDSERTADWKLMLTAARNAKLSLQRWEQAERSKVAPVLDSLIDDIAYSDPASLPALAELEYTMQLDIQYINGVIESAKQINAQNESTEELIRSIHHLREQVKARNLQLVVSK
ncbi:hypothetical protein D3P07_15475 [Paenibacillus sp. 1011MAR3C5]|uniref:hypothetical protein n=1 Tax=Paenibacillus sp. 1011MAR3C5 TaxID=1675787 RepID=UPI000E6BAE26|nr:hypothetical protein [Paenibacillus sp. 1011MAR3C5]RJE87706.1 hypothetical protein D3P07_15475 [Paenibacillus sp. 1011MAR3C5]